MKDFTKTFFDWADSKGHTREDVASMLNKQLQTISNWKSRGIPKSHQFACQALMDKSKSAKPQDDPNATIAIEYTGAEFDEIDTAAKLIDVPFRDFILRSSIARAREEIEKAKLLKVSPIEESDNILDFSIPLTSVAAGAPVSSQIDDTYQTAKEYKEGYFAAQAFGESMHPVIPNGSVSLIMGRSLWKNPHLKKGQIYTFNVNGEQTIKRYNTRPATPNEIERGESYIYASTTTGKPSVKVLESINPDFPEIIIENGDIEPTGWFESLLK